MIPNGKNLDRQSFTFVQTLAKYLNTLRNL